MFQDKYVFAQLTAFLNRTQLNNYVHKYDGNHYVLTDAKVRLTGYLSYPESFKLVRYYDEEKECECTFLTNAKHLTALEVA